MVASVTFELVTADSPFFELSDEWNALSLKPSTGRILSVRGRGAGRWPATESVVADAFELLRSREGTPLRIAQGAAVSNSST